MIADTQRADADPTTRWTEAARADVQRFWEMYDKHYEEIHVALDARLNEEPELRALAQALSTDGASEDTRDALRGALERDEWEPYLRQLRARGELFAARGISFRDWFRVISLFRMVIGPSVLQEQRDDLDRLAMARGVTHYTDIALGEIGQAYLEAKERLIRDQQEAIRDLSHPVLELRDGLLLLPLVGMIDSDRARRLTETLLEQISRRRASVVVMDLTGVPTMDTAVANHLMQTVAAARLMGASALITGISADNAQTLVRLGLDTSALDTMGDLMAGLAEADRLLAPRGTAPA